ncbi:Uncharacterized protein dnl_11950 [Desulfonema limicola]|uniref:Uncharacterized protein n=1 Tax=Desulfonema limicola TaxID=45656 RepID=A0A975B547_9BACT|nr:hypothetical protein [Desulfonema limicola]QTA78948.1 Uncharacterized protein dnl_11950 [Desulfonema limicola]
MKSVSFKSKIGIDGFLRVNIPTKIKEKHVEVLVIYDVENDTNDFETSDWPENYFTDTYGCLASDPIKRQPQGTYPDREQLQ